MCGGQYSTMQQNAMAFSPIIVCKQTKAKQKKRALGGK
jgi:hypothetical protein